MMTSYNATHTHAWAQPGSALLLSRFEMDSQADGIWIIDADAKTAYAKVGPLY
jgi:hypothetical protein